MRRRNNDQSNSPPEILLTGEVAAFLRKSRATVRRMIRSGRLPAVRIGGTLGILREDLNRFIKEARTP